MAPSNSNDNLPTASAWMRELFRGHGRWVSLAALATVIVQISTAGLAWRMDVPADRLTVGTLAVATLWVALTAGPLAAGAQTALGSILRGGVVVDASIPVLVLLAAAGPVTVLGAIEVYCILAAVALSAIALVRIAGTAWGRCALATVASVLLFVLLASPVWAGALLTTGGGAARRWVARLVVAVNPFYAVASATAESTGFVWHEAPLMYSLTPLGRHVVAPSPPWYATVVIYACVAAMFAGVAIVRKNRPAGR
ncbi:MAG: hypothetical protein ACOC9S_06125 [Planctomycetota bacterium]